LPLSKNINTYTDVAEILQAAKPHTRIIYDAGTRGKAVRFLQRCYQYRLLLMAQLKGQSAIKGYQPPTPYDRMKLSYVPGIPQHVIIDFDPAPQGEFILPGGERIAPTLTEAIRADSGVPLHLPALTPQLTEKDAGLLDALTAIVGEVQDED